MKSTTSSSFPDVNVWLALLIEDHIHRKSAREWWDSEDSEWIGFTRFTQVSVLRVLTTAAAMNNRPLNMRDAWKAYDGLFVDDRVALIPEPAGLESHFREYTRSSQASPKVWADAYLAAFAGISGAKVVTFDRALAGLAPDSLLLR